MYFFLYSHLSAVPRPTIADVNNYNPTFRTLSPIFQLPRLDRPRQPALICDSKKPRQPGPVVVITMPLTELVWWRN